MSKLFDKISIGFGNNKGETTMILLEQRVEKINRVDIKSQFGPNPKVTLKPIPEINLAPFTQMIIQKRDKLILQQLLRGNLLKSYQIQNLQNIKKKAQKDLQQLKNQLEFLKNCSENLQIDQIINKTGCTDSQAKKYYLQFKNSNKAIQMINEHNVKIEEVVKKFKCPKSAAKDLLQASNYDMNLLG